MTCCRETLNVKRISLWSLDVSRFTFHEQGGDSQAGR